MSFKTFAVLGFTTLLSIAMLSPALLAGDAKGPEGAGDTIGEAVITVVIGNAPMQGRAVLPATDTDFRLKLADTGDVVSLKWSQLEETHRKHIQKAYGMTLDDKDRPVFGEKLRGTRFFLDNGKSIDGMLLPTQNLPGRKIIRTSNMPFFPIPISQIKREEPWDCYESDIYSPKEIYEGWKFTKPPAHDDAAAHLELARKASGIRLYKEALEHLKAAEIIDPRTAERNADFKQELINLHAKQQSERLYDKLVAANNRKDYFEARNIMDQLERNFPYSDLKSRWDALRNEIEAGSKAELRKEVVRRAYSLFDELIHDRMARKVKVDEKGNEVPSIPGKQVTTRKNQIFTGVLQKMEGKDIYLLDPETATTIRIAGNQIVSETDIDLAKSAKSLEPTFDQLKDYVTDTGRPDGLKMQMIQRLAQYVKRPEKEVQAIFDARLDRNAVVDEEGNYAKDKNFAEIREVHMGRGSWLREGAKPTPITPVNANQPPRRTGTGRTGTGGNNNNQPQPQQQQAAREDQDPDLTDDPQVWWKFQPPDQRFAVLKALAAEKVFKLAKAYDDPCRSCQSTGKVPSVDNAGAPIQQRCPTCRGLQKMFKINYH